MNTTTQQDTQAAANKATEEGGRRMDEYNLPALPSAICSLDVDSAGTYVEVNRAGEKMYSEDQMHEYATQAIAADRASRQVANKAEVEPDVLDAHRYRWLRSNNIVVNVRFHFASGESPYLYAEALDEAIDHNMGYIPVATPPATTGGASATPTGASTARDQALEEAAAWHDAMNMNTSGSRAAYVHCQSAKAIRALKGSVGASTVLTDERIKEEMHAYFSYSGNSDNKFWAHVDDIVLFAQWVAAQAGQVSVPEALAILSDLTRPYGVFDVALFHCREDNRQDFRALLARTRALTAPSPAKESK